MHRAGADARVHLEQTVRLQHAPRGCRSLPHLDLSRLLPASVCTSEYWRHVGWTAMSVLVCAGGASVSLSRNTTHTHILQRNSLIIAISIGSHNTQGEHNRAGERGGYDKDDID